MAILFSLCVLLGVCFVACDKEETYVYYGVGLACTVHCARHKRIVLGNVTENDKKDGDWVQFNQDFFELVPTSVTDNPAKPEDQY